MSQQSKNAISPTRSENYPEWYQQVIKNADLAENSVVRGCMVIKPWGYAIWEKMQQALDKKFKDTGHVNAYFPLFIPLSFLEKEAKHVEGFAKECAVITHSKLVPGPDGKLIPSGKLEEPLIVRPTSETIIGDSYAKWVQSYRDLPILINQWANVVRWEMRTRLFLRTAEFLWQEGHTVHASKEEAMEETLKMLDVYADFAENHMAMPVIKGEKTADERFPGAVNTYCVEALMQDRKALQAGTSHFLGQNFAKASGIKFLGEDGKESFAWTTSWGVSTRLIGGLIMTHSDDDGLILPPRVAPKQIVIMPITRSDADKSTVYTFADNLKKELEQLSYHGYRLEVELDKRDTGGGKAWTYIKKGVPIRLEIGPRDIQSDSVFMGRRDKNPKEKAGVPRTKFVGEVLKTLDEMQENMKQLALKNRKDSSVDLKSMDDFKDFFKSGDQEDKNTVGGFAYAFASDDEVVNQTIKPYKVSARCIPLATAAERGKCIFTGKPDGRKVIFARAY